MKKARTMDDVARTVPEARLLLEAGWTCAAGNWSNPEYGITSISRTEAVRAELARRWLWSD